MKQVPLTRGMFALVDDEDFDRVSQFKWCARIGYNGNWYAGHYMSGKDDVFEYLHNFITGKKNVDHRDGDGLNNQRFNLRHCTSSQNAANSCKRRSAKVTSSYKGVSWDSTRHRWRMAIMINYKWIGKRFDTESEAALAYDFYARKFFGEFARCNFGLGELL